MKKVFDEVGSLDKRCYEKFGLSEDLLMENAASSMASCIQNKFPKNSKILIVSGSGNNGADGITLARILFGSYKIELFLPLGIKSSMAMLQLERAKKIGVKIVEGINNNNYDVIVECLFGSGFNKPISSEINELLLKLGSLQAYKIACDIPVVPFKADTTITMGSLKKKLFLDGLKDYVGEIIVGNLGVSQEMYETDTSCFLLEKSDMKLPFRKKLASHKGDFGHLAVVIGDKKGAGLIACEAGFTFGAGLVTAITKETNLPLHIMKSEVLPYNTTAIALGMGLGKNFQSSLIENEIPKIIDADIFYDEVILKILEQENIVLTPHPKEFCSLFEICGFGKITIDALQENRFVFVERFCQKYPKIVLLLKGANVIIAQNEQIFINTFGTPKLSFGGSGDVLSGLIGSLLAQKYTPLDATITASLAHSFASEMYNLNDYSMKPQDLIEGIRKL
jgi:ADP-dependent NAD(P)H-hydrate dehydratase / NAD(P)H-hydrate epimerase